MGIIAFESDKYRNLYDMTYSRFIVQLIKSEDDILNTSIQKVTSFIADCGNPEDIIGICNWIDSMSKDYERIDVKGRALDARRITNALFTNKVNELMDKGYLIKTTIPSEVTEAVFYIVSANIYCDKMVNLEKLVEAKQTAKATAALSKTAAYFIATIACVMVFFLYNVLAVVVFKFNGGGGFFPLLILFFCEVALWRWIVGFSKPKSKKR